MMAHHPGSLPPSWADPFVHGMSDAIGGPAGRHSLTGRQLWWTPLRVCLLAFCATAAVGFLAKIARLSGVGDTSIPTYQPFLTASYSELPMMYEADQQGLTEIDAPALQAFFRTVLTWLAQAISSTSNALPVVPHISGVTTYLFLSIVTIVVSWALVVRCTVFLAGTQPWLAALVAASPVLLVFLFVDFQSVVVAMVMIALTGIVRGQRVLSVISMGAALAFEPVLPLILLLCLLLSVFVIGAKSGDTRLLLLRWCMLSGLCIMVWLVFSLPAIILNARGWWVSLYSLILPPVAPESIYGILRSLMRGNSALLQRSTIFEIAVFVALFTIGTVLIALVAQNSHHFSVRWMPGVKDMYLEKDTNRQRERVEVGVNHLPVSMLSLRAVLNVPFLWILSEMTFVLLAFVELLFPGWRGQYSLWLVPFAALALRRFVPVLWLACTELLLWFAKMYYFLGVQQGGLPLGGVVPFSMARNVVLIVLIMLVLYHWKVVRGQRIPQPLFLQASRTR